MVDFDKVRMSGRDTMTGILALPECNLCGAVTPRWSDEKIKCKYCGELV